jgi:outer membrane protein OmpA-like peptidoglycan-associated protein
LRKILFIAVLALFAVPSYSHAWFWWSKEPAKDATLPQMEVQMMAHADSSGNQLTTVIPHEEFVMCTDCPAGMPLEREMAEVPVVIRMSAGPRPEQVAKANDPVEPSVTGADAAVPQVPEKVVVADPPKIALEETPKEKAAPAGASPVPTLETATGPCFGTPVHFELDKSEVTSAELKHIKNAEGMLKSSTTIEVKGFTCDLGSKKHNDKLAMERATAVADVLKQMGITPTSVTAEGKCCYMSPTKDLNRRVEITCAQSPVKNSNQNQNGKEK